MSKKVLYPSPDSSKNLLLSSLEKSVDHNSKTLAVKSVSWLSCFFVKIFLNIFSITYSIETVISIVAVDFPLLIADESEGFVGDVILKSELFSKISSD